MPSIAQPTRQVQLAIKFWWPGYDPEQAFDIFTAADVPLVAKTTDPTARQWQQPRPGATLAAVRDWMLDHDLRILGYERIAQRRNRRWEGLYCMQIGKELIP